MIPRVEAFVPLGAPGSPVQRIDSRPDALSDAVQRSFRLALLEAIARAPKPTPAAPPVTLPPAPMPAPMPMAGGDPAAEPASQLAPPPLDPAPTDETSIIRETAAHTGVDPRFLRALRRAENGGPGREFGVLSVPAPTYEDQARVAAESVRRNIERFERTGRAAIDPVSGQYTEDFIRFFSNRWAPIGAGNDPTGLNRHHAQNLLRIYAQLAPKND